jgi:site-specific DNA-cytosine methylase
VQGAEACGSSMGYKLAGCDVLGCLDIDKVQLMLYKDNLKPKYAFCDDIRDFFKRDAHQNLLKITFAKTLYNHILLIYLLFYQHNFYSF